MEIKQWTNGDLEMRAGSGERRLINQLNKLAWLNGYAKEAAFLAQALRPQYEQTSPASVSALTSAPCITDGIYAWGFMDYQIKSFLDILVQGDTVIWTKG